ncbi:MAG: LemA family protein [Planctomycetota bacterium]
MIRSSSAPRLSRPARRGGMMRGCLVAILALGVLALALGGCLAGTYNTIVTKEEAAAARLTEIDNQYQRRFDLIPQLVEVVKGASDFEQETIQAVTEARASVGRLQLPADAARDPAAVQRYLEAQEKLGGALSRLLVAVENYPALKATEAYRDLQAQVEGTENRLAVARRDYIDAVQDYNVAIKRFPGNLVASALRYGPMPQLAFEDKGRRERPAIDFSGEE